MIAAQEIVKQARNPLLWYIPQDKCSKCNTKQLKTGISVPCFKGMPRRKSASQTSGKPGTYTNIGGF